MKKNPLARLLPVLALLLAAALTPLPAAARYADDFDGHYEDLACSEDDCDCLEPDSNRFKVVSPCNVPATGTAVVFTGAWHEVQAFYDAAGQTDGLPVVPPTTVKVEKFMRYTPYAPDAVVAAPAGRPATAWQVAANAVMAGCTADHLPLCIAIVKALGDDAYLAELAAGTRVPLAFVNGPAGRQIGVDHEQGMTTEEVNIALARFIELALVNLAGLPPNRGGTFGTVQALVFSEDDEACLAAGWQPWHVQLGYGLGDNTVTMTSFDMWGNNSTPATDWPEEIMKLVAWDATEKNLGGLGAAPTAAHAATARTILVTPPVALALSALYRSKEALAGDLESTARRPMAMRAFAYYHADTDGVRSSGKTLDETYRDLVAREAEDARMTPAPAWLAGIANPKIMTGSALKASNTRILVTGDASRNKTQVMPGGKSVTVELELSDAWDELNIALQHKPLSEYLLAAPDDAVAAPIPVPAVLSAGIYRILDPATGSRYLTRAGRLYYDSASNTLHSYPVGASAAVSTVLDPAEHAEFIRYISNLGWNSSFTVAGGNAVNPVIRFPSNDRKLENNTVALAADAFAGTLSLHANNATNSNAAGGLAADGAVVRLSGTVTDFTVDLDSTLLAGPSTAPGFLTLEGGAVTLDPSAPAGATALLGAANGDGTYRTLTFAQRPNGTVEVTYNRRDTLSLDTSAVELKWTAGGETTSTPFSKTGDPGIYVLTRKCPAGQAAFSISVANVRHGSGTLVTDACDRLQLAPSNTCTLRLTTEDYYTFRYDARDDKLTLVRDVAKAGLCTGGTIDNIAGTYILRPDGTGAPLLVSDLADNPSFAVSFNGLPVPGQAFEGLPEGATEGMFSLALKPPVAQAVRIGLPSSPDAVSVVVETFANLHYTLQRTSDLREGFLSLDSPGAAAVGTGESVDLLDAAADLPGNAAFYRIHVATPPAPGP
jgi:hypothetical protein